MGRGWCCWRSLATGGMYGSSMTSDHDDERTSRRINTLGSRCGHARMDSSPKRTLSSSCSSFGQILPLSIAAEETCSKDPTSPPQRGQQQQRKP